jgi:hypothetical protein
MDRFDSIIFIAPNIGEQFQANIFARNLNQDELKFLDDDLIIEYRKKHSSYTECLMDIKEKMKKIKQILEE